MDRRPKVKIAIIQIDWFKIFHDLKLHQKSLYVIHDELDIPKSTLLGYKAGREPRHDDGELLLAYWCMITKNSRELAHQLDIYSRK